MKSFISSVIIYAVFPPILVLAGVASCGGGSPPPRSQPELTSAPVPAVTPELTEARTRLAQVERERDDAQRQLQEERNRVEQATRGHQARADFERKEREKLDTVDWEIRTLLEKVGRAPAAERTRIEELSRKREEVEKLLRRAPEESADKWQQFKAEVDTSIDDLKRSVESTRAR